MLEIFKMAMKNPLQATIAVCLSLSLLSLAGLVDVRSAVAALEAQQADNDFMFAKMMEMNDLIIRVDENVKILKEQTTKEN